MDLLLFGVYPYVCLTLFTAGLIFRYVATPGEWNARSSNLFAKKSLVAGSFLFHYAIIFTFFGHVAGLLLPVALLRMVDFTGQVHFEVATWFGRLLAPCVFAGAGILLLRRLCSRNVWASTVPMDIVVLLFILLQACTGGYQDYTAHEDVLPIIGAWARGVITCQPEPSLMAGVPWFMQLHVVSGLAIFAMVPFSRLVHFMSLPLTWFARPLILYRRRYDHA